jgi:hypothetical protein
MEKRRKAKMNDMERKNPDQISHVMQSSNETECHQLHRCKISTSFASVSGISYKQTAV